MTPTLPPHMAALPLDAARRPVPHFVEWIDGKPDFRVMDTKHFVRALRLRRCWVCDGALGAHMAFVIGPMCVVNRVSSEPPCHYDCAAYSVQACPFLSNPDKVRRESHMPDEGIKPAGVMIARNPSVSVIWVTKSYSIEKVPAMPEHDVQGGVLIKIGDPTRVEWWARGRRATSDECKAAMRTGMPTLMDAATKQGPRSVAALSRAVDKALVFLP